MRSQELTHYRSSVTSLLSVVLTVWLALIFFLASSNMFVRPPGALPLPILVAVTVPIIAFLATFWMLRAFRDFVLTIDPILLTAIQAWRFVGLGFLALYAHGVLPGIFAWPAGVGDMAIAITAPWLTLALIRRPNFAGSKIFRVWNVLGILDLVVAVSAGALSSALALGSPGEISTAPMASLPLVVIPAYLVPIFIMAHLAALFQAQRLTVSRPSGALVDSLCSTGKV
jgi:hypothetical protein